MHLAPYTLKIEDYKKDGEREAARETEPNSKSFFISRAVRCFYDTAGPPWLARPPRPRPCLDFAE